MKKCSMFYKENILIYAVHQCEHCLLAVFLEGGQTREHYFLAMHVSGR